MALSADPSKLSGAVPNKRGWWAWAIAGVGGGGGGGGLPPGGGCMVGACGWCTRTTGGFGPCLLGAEGPLDVRGVQVCVGWEGLDDMARGGGSGTGCFPLDTGGVRICCSRECGLEIWGNKLSCNCGVPGKLASLSVVAVIASSADCSNLLTLAVLSSELLSLSEVSGWFSSDVWEPLKCTVQLLRYFHMCVGSDR
jgi:hypothetical protein